MYLSKAKKLLDWEYEQRKRKNIDNFRLELMEEKIRHSYQVLGVGNYILEHEACFSNCKDEEREYLQAAVLLHDIGRFYEVIVASQGERIDHGVYGAQMLTHIPEFNKFDIVLAIRHHGHIIEDMYNDDDYKRLSLEQQERVKQLAFLIRDADKLANFYLLATHFKDIENVFFPSSNFKSPSEKKVSVNVLADFTSFRTVNRKEIRNFADHALGFLSWVFDVNYYSSFIFMEKLNLIDRLCQCLSQFWEKRAAKNYQAKIEEYVVDKMRMLKNK